MALFASEKGSVHHITSNYDRLHKLWVALHLEVESASH
ncbi:hypothetical protein Xmir_01419 [Xenorhabdus miraniensis]|uniref:Uncharacterized protein n=1 Tax=Xenorhabdus miraniensis TaxID=351674 RepID=A0A2D0JT70_9GAMM|nr:hypothetical protein Xmir_01419 [Xenorhabdus miraniensis]